MGWIIIVNFLCNFCMNIAVIGSSVVADLVHQLKEFKEQVLRHRLEQETKRRKLLLVQTLGAEVFPNINRQLEEQEAIKFCKSYNAERLWCKKYGLDYSCLEDEQKFLKYLDEYRYRERRDLVTRKDAIEQIVQTQSQNQTKRHRDRKVSALMDELFYSRMKTNAEGTDKTVNAKKVDAILSAVVHPATSAANSSDEQERVRGFKTTAMLKPGEKRRRRRNQGGQATRSDLTIIENNILVTIQEDVLEDNPESVPVLKDKQVVRRKTRKGGQRNEDLEDDTDKTHDELEHTIIFSEENQTARAAAPQDDEKTLREQIDVVYAAEKQRTHAHEQEKRDVFSEQVNAFKDKVMGFTKEAGELNDDNALL